MTCNLDSSISQNIFYAVSYLTRPLDLIHDKSTIFSAQLIPQSTLDAAFHLSPACELILSLSASSLPALPILAACVASNIMWGNWILVLGGRDLDLIIRPHAVYIRVCGSSDPLTIVWKGPMVRAPVKPVYILGTQVPISKLGQSGATQQPSLLRKGNILTRLTHPHTLGERLVEEGDKHALEELFAITKDAPVIISPTPTREKFNFPAMRIPTLISPPSSPEPSSSESSRPSSRSSCFSTYSFSSSEESLTSQSSTMATDDSESTTSAAYIDSNKKDITKYLYQGGVSTVLTGGVMLGGSSAASKPKPRDETSTIKSLRYYTPIGANKPICTGRFNASAGSWRPQRF